MGTTFDFVFSVYVQTEQAVYQENQYLIGLNLFFGFLTIYLKTHCRNFR